MCDWITQTDRLYLSLGFQRRSPCLVSTGATDEVPLHTQLTVGNAPLVRYRADAQEAPLLAAPPIAGCCRYRERKGEA